MGFLSCLFGQEINEHIKSFSCNFDTPNVLVRCHFSPADLAQQLFELRGVFPVCSQQDPAPTEEKEEPLNF